MVVSSPSLGVDLQPALNVGDSRLLLLIKEVCTLYQTDVEVFIGDKVPGLAAVTAFPQRLLVIDRSLLVESDLALRFLLGYALEAIRGGYALLLYLNTRQRLELGSLLKSLLLPEAERAGPTNEFIRTLSKRAHKVLERWVGQGRETDTDGWIDGMLNGAKRGGLLASDDFAAATWMVARLSGENFDNHESTVALGAVLGGPDLVRFYLGDDYHRLREYLAAPVPAGGLT